MTATPQQHRGNLNFSTASSSLAHSIAGSEGRGFESCSNSSLYPASERAVYGILGAALSGYITAVNLAILVVFLRDRSVRRVPGHVFIVGLMVSSDILIGLLALPGYLVQTLCGGWPLPKWCCDLWITVDYLSTNVSMLSVTTVAFDRFLATNFVFTHKRWMHRANQIRLCVGVWAFTAVRCVATFPVWAIASGYRARERYGECGHPIYGDMVAGLVQRTVALYIPVILLVFFYGAVVFRILKSSSTFGASVIVLRGGSHNRLVNHRRHQVGGGGGVGAAPLSDESTTPVMSTGAATASAATPATTEASTPSVAGSSTGAGGQKLQFSGCGSSSSPRLTPMAALKPRGSCDLRSLGGSCQTLALASGARASGGGCGISGGGGGASGPAGNGRRGGGTLASRLSKSFRMVSCVMAAFLLANMPWQVIENMIATGATSVRKTDALYVLLWILSYMNAFLNPLFYCFMNKEYKKAMLRFVRCHSARVRGRHGMAGCARRPTAACVATSASAAAAAAAAASFLLDNSDASAVETARPEVVGQSPGPPLTSARQSVLCVCEPEYRRLLRLPQSIQTVPSNVN